MSLDDRLLGADETVIELATILAVDVPPAGAYASHLLGVAPELAAVIMTARKTPNGWRIRLPADDPALRALRALGMVEVYGNEPSPSDIQAGLGTHLTGYAVNVMAALYGAMRVERELRTGLDREEARDRGRRALAELDNRGTDR